MGKAAILLLLLLSTCLSWGASVDDAYTLPTNLDTFDLGAPIKAFRGAEGAGCGTANTHARSASAAVIKVTNLNNSGAGSFRACVETTGPAYCIFEVSGNIELTSRLYVKGQKYIAGQTAPYPGITIKNYSTYFNGDDILSRHIRWAQATENPTDNRPANLTSTYGDNYCNRNASGSSDCPQYSGSKVSGTDASGDSLIIPGRNQGATSTSDICISHNEILWGWSRNLSIADNQNWSSNASAANNVTDRVTVVDSIIAEPLWDVPFPNDHWCGVNGDEWRCANQGPSKYDGGAGSSSTMNVVGTYNNDISFARNLWYGTHRSPLIDTGAEVLMLNNRVGPNNYFNGAHQSSGSPIITRNSQMTAIGNHLIGGTNLSFNYYYRRTLSSAIGDFYADDNLLINGLELAQTSTLNVVGSPLSDDLDNFTVMSSSDVDEYVRSNSGMRPADRDPLTTDVISRAYANNTYQRIDCVRGCTYSAGGWNTATGTRVLAVPANPNNDDNNDGYPNIEEWLESYAASVEVSSALNAPFLIVAKTGSDSPSCGTVSSPCFTIQEAANKTSAGYTVYIRNGTYNENILVTQSGTSGSPITYTAYPNESPVISGTHQTPSYGSATEFNPSKYLLRIYANYVHVKNLEFSYSAATGILIGQTGYTGNVIDNNYVHHTYLTGIKTTANNGNTISNNIVHNTLNFQDGGDWETCAPGTDPSGNNTCGGNADCIGGGAVVGEGLNPNPHGFNTFINNVVYNCGDDGIDTFNSKGNTVKNNIVFHTGYAGSTNNPAGNGNGFKMGATNSTYPDAGSNQITNNITYGNRNRGYNTNGGVNNVYLNNSVWDSNTNTEGAATWTNNLSYNGSNTSVGTQTTNSWNLGITDPKLQSYVYGEAGFATPILVPSSPVIDVGTDVGLPFNGSAPDLGAVETTP